jgi:hypothetical protein
MVDIGRYHVKMGLRPLYAIFLVIKLGCRGQNIVDIGRYHVKMGLRPLYAIFLVIQPF